MKRYLVCPGWVMSRTDGDRHWIGASQLMQLYGVSPAECVIARNGIVLPAYRRADLIDLHVRYSGDYSLPGGGE